MTPVKWFRRRLPAAPLLLPVTWMLDEGRKLTFYPAREGLFIPWEHDAESGLCLPFYFERPPKPTWHPNVVFLDPDVQKTRSFCEDWDVLWFEGEIPCIVEQHISYGAAHAGKFPECRIFLVHPETWAVLPDDQKAALEPYEVREVPPVPGNWIQFTGRKDNLVDRPIDGD